VRVVDQNGEQLGILETAVALKKAEEVGLDLVEVAATAKPPVCRIMDFGKYKYQKKKRQQEAKKKATVIHIKEIKIRPKTDEHDFQTKMKHLKRFIEEGDKVKVTMMFRGREIAYADSAMKTFEKIIEELKDVAVIESRPKIEGRNMMMIVVGINRN
jgi:translation initiation factor IF-3